ncbi:MAG: cob(I)yrinic acid a,c-diamide adenosyltransferase [Bdellovibrionales bacterium]|nr:cob(I)yrinic acid a,c-diamide adenosyltransferase [Bdellovibrionales bacterium]
MVKLNKLYTKVGDQGETFLVGGKRTSKADLRVRAFGEVDELNAIIGMIRTLAEQHNRQELTEKLSILQNELFDAGAELATANGEIPTVQIVEMQYKRLESWIDQLTSKLDELKSFVLPGGTELNSWLHLARAVTRRAERSIVQLSNEQEVGGAVLIYFNRLSDLLFALARHESCLAQVPEYLWQPGKSGEPS